MSKKTIFKRIALTAVSALAAGTLSVVVAPTANAAAGDIEGINASSTGVLASALSSRTTTKTATLLSTGTLVIDVDSADSGCDVSAGAFISAFSGTSAAVDADQNTFTAGNADNTFSVRPTGAPGSTFTVTCYDSTATGTPPVNVLTVTIAATSVAGVVAPSESGVWWVASAAEGTADVAGENTTTYGTALYLDIDLADAYGASITGTTGALVVSVTDGAVVGLGTSATTGTFSTAVSSRNPSADFVTITEKTAGAGWAGTVTVTYNGTVVATKSGVITGVPAKIVATPVMVGKNNGSATTDSFTYKVTDSRGNLVVITASTLTLNLSSNTSIVSNAVGTTAETTSAAGKGDITCVSSASGSADVTLQHILANGTVLKSNVMKVNCGGIATNYKASWDKASYAQGELATLTVQFTDSKGNPANSSDAVSNGSAGSSSDIVITANQLERATAHAASTKVNVDGQVKYTFTVGTSSGVVPGAYAAIVSFPTINSAVQGAVTVPYTITAPATVSNAEVLASIVKLIATINKQIRALQKQLRR